MRLKVEPKVDRPLWQGSARGPAPRDDLLPALAEALDPEAMQRRFRTLGPFFEGLETIETTYARYKPGQSCIIQYRLKYPEQERLIHGRLVPDGNFESLSAKARATIRSHPEEGPGLHTVPAMRLLLTTFPHDRRLRRLKILLDPGKLKRLLQSSLPMYHPGLQKIKAKRTLLEVVSYKPERRCLVRCRVKSRNLLHGGSVRRTLFARANADDSGYRAMRVLNALRASSSFRPGSAPVPEPLGYDPENRFLFTSQVPGRPLFEGSANGYSPEAFQEIGSLLARLHSVEGDLPAACRADDILEDAALWGARLGRNGVAEAEMIQAAAARLSGERPAVGSDATGCVHGDFHPIQVLADGNELHIIDFGQAGVGERALDLGYFTAHLHHMVRVGILSRQEAAEGETRFLQGYGVDAEKPTSQAAIRWHHDLTLLRLALTAVKEIQEGWPEAVQHYLAGGAS